MGSFNWLVFDNVFWMRWPLIPQSFFCPEMFSWTLDIYPIYLFIISKILFWLWVYLIRLCNFILLHLTNPSYYFYPHFGSHKDILRYNLILWDSFTVLFRQEHHDQRKSNRWLSLIKRTFLEIIFQLPKKIMLCTDYIFHSLSVKLELFGQVAFLLKVSYTIYCTYWVGDVNDICIWLNILLSNG